MITNCSIPGHDKDKKWLDDEKDRFDNELDWNKDGLLDRQEIISWVLPSNECDTLYLFDNIQKLIFFTTWLIRNYHYLRREIAGEESAHLFASADDNHGRVDAHFCNLLKILFLLLTTNLLFSDEVLTPEEILEHHDTFVGSEGGHNLKLTLFCVSIKLCGWIKPCIKPKMFFLATDYGDHLHNLEKFKDEL